MVYPWRFWGTNSCGIDLLLWVFFSFVGKMSIVSVDDRGRITIPKELGIRNTRVVIIPAGSFFVTIPLPESPMKTAEGWLDSEKTKAELKAAAEKKASVDAVERAKRRKQA